MTNEGYLGCRKCIEEKRSDPAEMRASGSKVFIGLGCTMKCIHHGIDMEYIEPKLESEMIK